ncbi:N-methyl-L-tryptophan oxidase [Natronorubrum sp. FCH18a]|uniref:N-methyl-L-tryptophan oxidase n=1 Tax=Natronorubrum sp. FCH18a TaxID=3447018 RepID=UPI003F515FA7
MADQTMEYEAIVLGVGGMGSAAVYHLAKRGADVLGIEQFDIPHARGSSHGDTRIFRLTQSEHPGYGQFAKRARELWWQLEEESGEDILTVTGSIQAGLPDGPEVRDEMEVCEANDLEYELLSGEEMNERFPGYELPDHYQGVYQPDGGFLACEKAIIEHVKQAHAAGGTVHARERVRNWKPDEGRVRLETDRGTYVTDNLVVTAGGWAAKHLDVLEGHLVPERRVMAWLQTEAPAKFTPENFPVFDIAVPEGTFYGFPEYGRPGFKFGRSPDLPEPIDPDDWRDEPTLQDEELLRQLPRNYFPEAAGPTMALSSCIVTSSTDGYFYIDQHPDHPQVAIAAGFSGHGYKYCSVVGETLADLVTDGETENHVDLFRFDGRL